MREDAMLRFMNLLLAVTALSGASIAGPQSTLGALLDAGAKTISAEEFKEQIVQRVLTGPTGAGGSHELMYAANGSIQGSGVPREALRWWGWPVSPVRGPTTRREGSARA